MNEIQLKQIVKADGTHVRMANLKEGDIFDMYITNDGVEEHLGRWQADEDGYVQSPENNFGDEFIGIGAVNAHQIDT